MSGRHRLAGARTRRRARARDRVREPGARLVAYIVDLVIQVLIVLVLGLLARDPRARSSCRSACWPSLAIVAVAARLLPVLLGAAPGRRPG